MKEDSINEYGAMKDILHVITWVYLFAVGIAGILLNGTAMTKAMKVKLNTIIKGQIILIRACILN